MCNDIKDVITSLIGEFVEVNESFINLYTGEIFTKREREEYIKKKIEIHNAKTINKSNHELKEVFGIDPDQRIINKRSRKKSSKNLLLYNKDDNVNFNIVWRDKVADNYMISLTKNEKLVYYVLRDFVAYPSNCIMINGKIPAISDLEKLTSLTNKSIGIALKSLEEKGLFKLVKSGHKNAIYVNPEYYACGKELDPFVVNLFCTQTEEQK